MKITSIKQQAKRADRYSVFVEGKYAFSLSENALLESKITSGQELTAEELKGYKQLSADDKIYSRALRYVAMRQRSEWEIEFYLHRKQASPTLISTILNKLRDLELIDDRRFARAFIHDKMLQRPTSRRKIILELKKKHVAAEVIEEALRDSEEVTDDKTALLELIARKRRQAKYQDDLKLMQYLARQGFGYSDIKSALNADASEEL
jgi:regulatory protein